MKDVCISTTISVIIHLFTDVFTNALDMSIHETIKSVPCPVDFLKSVKHYLVAEAFEEHRIISRFKGKFEHPVRKHAFRNNSLGSYGYCFHETHVLSLTHVDGSP